MSEKIIPDEIMIIPLPPESGTLKDTEYEPLRGDEERAHKGIVKAATVRLSELSTGLAEFMGQVEVLFKDAPLTVGDFALDEVEISAGVTVNGKFVLFGIGAEGGVDGGLRFVFRRTSQEK